MKEPLHRKRYSKRSVESNIIIVSKANTEQHEQTLISFLRERQMAGICVNDAIDGQVPWKWAMDKKSPRCVELLMSLGANIDQRILNGRGFLLHAMDQSMPRWILIHGLRRLDKTWWHPDDRGRSPFNHPNLDAVVASAIGHRAWAEGLDILRLIGGNDPIEMARWRGQPEVARALSQWLRRH